MGVAISIQLTDVNFEVQMSSLNGSSLKTVLLREFKGFANMARSIAETCWESGFDVFPMAFIL